MGHVTHPRGVSALTTPSVFSLRQIQQICFKRTQKYRNHSCVRRTCFVPKRKHQNYGASFHGYEIIFFPLDTRKPRPKLGCIFYVGATHTRVNTAHLCALSKSAVGYEKFVPLFWFWWILKTLVRGKMGNSRCMAPGSRPCGL